MPGLEPVRAYEQNGRAKMTPQKFIMILLINPFEIVYARFRILQFEKFLINRELINGLRRIE